MKNILSIKGMVTVMALLGTFVLLAQPPAPPATPIDGGLSLLLALGGAYGVKKLASRKK